MDNGYLKRIGLNIASIRQSQGLSQRRLSSMIGLDRVTLNKIESGCGNPTIKTLERIAEGLDTSLFEVFDYHRSANETKSTNKNQR